MKRTQQLWFLALLIGAALLGWLLPPAVFYVEDRVEEAKHNTLQIKQFDLSYQSDLDAATRLQMIHNEAGTAATPLERGIYLQQQDVVQISEQFLFELTGFRFSLRDRCEIVPTLLRYSGGGTMIGWTVTAYLNEYWSWNALIDDQTGLILRCGFEGRPGHWDSLFREIGSAPDAEAFIAARVSEALCSHFNARLSANLMPSIQRDVSGDYVYTANVTLAENGVSQYTIPVTLILEGYMISIN